MEERKAKRTFYQSLPAFNMKVAWFVSLMLLISFQLVGQKLIPYLSQGKYGYADPQGQIRIAPMYEEVEFFDRFDVAAVRLDTQWFLINLEGTRLVKLETKKYNVYQGISAYGPTQYGNRKNIDTIPHLLRLELYGPESRQYIHTLSGKVSPVFSNFNRTPPITGMLTGFEGLLTQGLYIGQTGITEHKAMNTQADIIATSYYRPILLNDSLISYMEDTFSVILNFKTNKTFTLPFFNTDACIAGTNFIVTYLHQSWEGLLRQNICLYKGLVDRNGTILIKPQYDELAPFGENLLQAKKDNYWHLITNEGNQIDSNVYRHIFETGGHYFKAQLPNHKWIFIDSTGEQVLDQELDKIEFNKNCECYLVNADSIASILTDRLVLEIGFKAEKLFRTDNSRYYIFYIGKNYGLLDQEGNIIIPPVYQWCYLVENPGLVIIQQNGLKGIINFSGHVLMEPEYEDIGIEMFQNQSYIWVKKDGMYAYFDEQLNQLSDFQLKFRYLYSDPIYSEQDENDSIHLYNRFGKSLRFTAQSISRGYIESDSTYLTLAQKNESSILLYEKDNKLMIDTFRVAEAQCYNLDAGLIGVRMDGQEGVRNHLGQWIVPPGPHKVVAITPYIIVCKKDSTYTFYTFCGKRTHTLKCSSLNIEPYYSVWEFTYKNKNGYISAYTGKIIVPPKFDYGFFNYNDCIVASIHSKNGNNKFFAFDTLGRVKLRTHYSDMYPIDYNDVTSFYRVEKNGKAGLIDSRGQILIPLVFRSASTYADTTFFVARNEDQKRYIYNRNGDIVFSGSTLPVGKDKIEPPNHPIYFTHEYDELPGHRYLFYYPDYCLIVDHLGRNLKRIDNIDVKLEHGRYPDERFIEVKENGQVYLIDPVSLVSFREESNK